MSESVKIPEYLTGLLSNPTDVADRISSAGMLSPTITGLATVAAVGFAFHGFIMGCGRLGWQTFASTIKAPFVPLLSLLVTTPLLHTVALGVGGDWSLGQTIALALYPLAITAILLTASAPLLLFFSATSGYNFNKLLHVGAMALFSLWGVVTLMRVLWAMSGPNIAIFVAWVLAFFFVAAQMAWILRPFIGSPDKPFRWFGGRDEHLNFYTAVLLSLSEEQPEQHQGVPKSV